MSCTFCRIHAGAIVLQIDSRFVKQATKQDKRATEVLIGSV